MQNGSLRTLSFCPAKLQPFFQWFPHYVQNNWTLTLVFIGERESVSSLAHHTNNFLQVPNQGTSIPAHTPWPQPCAGGLPWSSHHPRSSMVCPAWNTHRDGTSHQGQQSHVQQNNLAQPQLICFSPSIHKTQRQEVQLSLHGNEGLTPALLLFPKSEYKTFSAILNTYPVLFALQHQFLIKSLPLLQHLSFSLAVWELQVCLGSSSANWPTYYHKGRYQQNFLF